MRDRVHEHQGITGLQIDLDGAFHDLVFLLGALAKILAEDGMGEIALVAAGKDARPAIAGPDVRQGEEDVDLPATELAIDEAVLVAHHAILPA
jgi:hypothetical protein